MTAVLPDAAPTNWVDRHAPASLRPWLKLGRFDRPTGIWLLMLPGWQGIALASSAKGEWPSLWLLFAFFLGAALMRAAGCAYNDIVDRDIDAKVARTALRPIPAGDISVKQAWAFLVGCSLTALVILLTLNLWSVILGVASLGLVAAYPFMKRITWWPQAWLGLTFNWGALMGFAAATGGVAALLTPWVVNQYSIGMPPETAARVGDSLMGHPPNLAALLLYASGVLWTLGYDTIYAVQDIEDDALAGVKSSARRLGTSAPRAVLGFYLGAFVLLLAAAWAGGLGPLFLPLAAAAAVMLSTQAARLKLDDPAHALALFKANTWVGVVVFAGLVAGLWKP